ncbi:MAG: site-specific DNA-methyltransferase [bacterium]
MTKKDYTKWDRNELIKEIDYLRNRKKYGLVWEDKQEDVVEQCKKELPVLEEVKSKEIITDPDKPINLLIEGDNYHALSVLNYTHKGKIDVIYIDPPYNTGNKDFVYNDQYVDAEDGYKHSKWLSFMSKRLELAKNLLKNTGVIFISIDDNEVHNLRHLCDDIFGENNFIAQIIRASSPTQNITRFISVMHDYCLVYCKDKLKNDGNWQVKKNGAAEFENKAKKLLKSGLSFVEIENELKHLVKYPRFFDFDHYYYVDEKGVYQTVSAGGVKKGNSQSILFHPKTKKPCKIPENGWRYKEGEIRRLENENLWHFGIDETTIPRKKLYLNDYIMQKPKGIGFFDSQSDVRYLKNLEVNFDFPKPTSFIRWLLQMTSSDKAIILDFMAGSGSTGHAVLDLNKEDQGNRKFILCTNNELNGKGSELARENPNKNQEEFGICRRVCYPRLRNVINGCKELNDNTIEDIGGNLKYFKTSFVPADPTDKNKIELTQKATEMLCVKEDTFEEVKSNKQYKIFRNKKRYTGIVFDHQAIDDFKKEIARIDGKFSVYIFSLSNDDYSDEFFDIKKKIKLSPIPEVILEVYREIFKAKGKKI